MDPLHWLLDLFMCWLNSKSHFSRFPLLLGYWLLMESLESPSFKILGGSAMDWKHFLVLITPKYAQEFLMTLCDVLIDHSGRTQVRLVSTWNQTWANIMQWMSCPLTISWAQKRSGSDSVRTTTWWLVKGWFLFVCYLLGGHTQQCLESTPGSAWGSYGIEVELNPPRFGEWKESNLATVLFFALKILS